jgi:lipopolysaccharide transport system permease protein
MVGYRFVPGVEILVLPLFVLLIMITALGAGLIVATLNVKYRDFRYIIPVIVQFGVYVTPVAFQSNQIYSNEHIPKTLKYLYSINPMVGVIDGFRWCILGDKAIMHWPEFFVSISISIFLLIFGFLYFRRMEKTLADVI